MMTAGGAMAFVGFWIAYQWDCPIGPTDVVLLGIIYAFAFAVRKSVLLVQLKCHQKALQNPISRLKS
jgi:ABC-type Mn2+/Zn2+ transport system permease subunit